MNMHKRHYVDEKQLRFDLTKLVREMRRERALIAKRHKQAVKGLHHHITDYDNETGWE